MNNDVNERQKSVSKEIEYVCVGGGGWANRGNRGAFWGLL